MLHASLPVTATGRSPRRPLSSTEWMCAAAPAPFGATTALTPPDERGSANDAVFEMRDAGRFDCTDLLELEVGAEAVKEPCAAAEDERDDVQLELVDVPSRQVLVDDAGAAADEYILPASRVPGLVERRLDPVGHERERRVRERERLSLVMRE